MKQNWFFSSQTTNWLNVLKHFSVCKRLPFVWRNPLGFSVAIAIQYTMMSYAAMIGACIIAFAFGFYLYTTAMTKCIQGSLFHINRSAQSKNNRKNIHEQLAEFIRFHSRVKQLSFTENFDKFYLENYLHWIWNVDQSNSYVSNFSDFFQHFLTLLFGWSLVTICGVLLKIQVDIVKYCIELSFYHVGIETS